MIKGCAGQVCLYMLCVCWVFCYFPNLYKPGRGPLFTCGYHMHIIVLPRQGTESWYSREISKLDLFSLIQSLFLVLDGCLSTKIDPKNWNRCPKSENLRINIFTPLSRLDFKGLAQNILLKPLHTWWGKLIYTVVTRSKSWWRVVFVAKRFQKYCVTRWSCEDWFWCCHLESVPSPSCTNANIRTWSGTILP
jgi:hypothetical protein